MKKIILAIAILASTPALAYESSLDFCGTSSRAYMYAAMSKADGLDGNQALEFLVDNFLDTSGPHTLSFDKLSFIVDAVYNGEALKYSTPEEIRVEVYGLCRGKLR